MKKRLFIFVVVICILFIGCGATFKENTENVQTYHKTYYPDLNITEYAKGEYSYVVVHDTGVIYLKHQKFMSITTGVESMVLLVKKNGQPLTVDDFPDSTFKE